MVNPDFYDFLICKMKCYLVRENILKGDMNKT
jgi:hypothetical protein